MKNMKPTLETRVII